jgi:predicted DNA-binding protein (MmcQ/YjbR family)
MSVTSAGTKIAETVATWENTSQAPHRFGGTEFRVGRREIGHVHGDRLVDIPFPKAIRNEIVAKGEAEPHHILPNSGWVSVYLSSTDDVERALRLLRRSYELAMRSQTRNAPSRSDSVLRAADCAATDISRGK